MRAHRGLRREQRDFLSLKPGSRKRRGMNISDDEWRPVMEERSRHHRERFWLRVLQCRLSVPMSRNLYALSASSELQRLTMPAVFRQASRCLAIRGRTILSATVLGLHAFPWLPVPWQFGCNLLNC